MSYNAKVLKVVLRGQALVRGALITGKQKNYKYVLIINMDLHVHMFSCQIIRIPVHILFKLNSVLKCKQLKEIASD